jgi:manganese/zinc/iron transport system permease protein
LGMYTSLWHYLLMGATSITTVSSFDVAGVVLIVAFIVAPAATAYLLTDSLYKMLLLSSAIGILSAILGYILALIVNGSIAGAMATMSGLIFATVFLAKKLLSRSKTHSFITNPQTIGM